MKITTSLLLIASLHYSGKYTIERSVQLPVTEGYGVTNFFSFIDFDKDDREDIVVGKTGDGTSIGFYQGYYLQLIQNNGTSFVDVSSKIQQNSSTTGGWVLSYLCHDYDGDGDIDITTEDKFYNLQWRNDNGTFVKD